MGSHQLCIPVVYSYVYSLSDGAKVIKKGCDMEKYISHPFLFTIFILILRRYLFTSLFESGVVVLLSDFV
jgi:hypothetical protein